MDGAGKTCVVQGSDPRLGTCVCQATSSMQICHCALDPSLVKGPIALGTRYRSVSRDDGGGGQGLLPQGLCLAFVSFVLAWGVRSPIPSQS